MAEPTKTFLELARECERKFGLPDTPNLALKALIQAVIRGEPWAVKDAMDRFGYKYKDEVQNENGVNLVFQMPEPPDIIKNPSLKDSETENDQ